MIMRLPHQTRIFFNAEGGATGGGDPAPSAAPAADPAAAAPAADPAPSAAPASYAAKPSIAQAALDANNALAGVQDPKPGEADGKPADGEAGAKGEGDQPQSGAPESYADFTFADGYGVQPDVLEEAAATFKELGLPQDKAQKLIDTFVSAQQKIEAGWVKEVSDQWDNFTKDAEFYKDGKLTPAAEQAYGTVRSLDPEISEFVGFLNKNGGMFHPGFAKIVKMVNAGVGEGTFAGGKPADQKSGTKGFYAKTDFKKKS